MGMNRESIDLLQLNCSMIKSQMLNSISMFLLIEDYFQCTYDMFSL